MSDGFFGEIRLFPYTFAPVDWTPCNGQLLSIASFQALFAVIGNTYGGDGRTNFAVPDLRGRAPIMYGQGPGLDYYSFGHLYGQASVTLTQSSMPNHSHQGSLSNVALEVDNSTAPGTDASPQIGQVPGGIVRRGTKAQYVAEGSQGTLVDLGNLSVGAASATILPTGGNVAHENRQPFLAMAYCICTDGVFPSRN